MFLSFSIFPFGRHCWRRWSKLNPKVHKISIGCTRTFKPNFVWYLEKQNRFDIKTWSIYRVLGGVHPLVRAHQLLGRHTHLLLSLHLFVSSNLKDGIKKIPTLIAFFKQLLSMLKWRLLISWHILVGARPLRGRHKHPSLLHPSQH